MSSFDNIYGFSLNDFEYLKSLLENDIFKDLNAKDPYEIVIFLKVHNHEKTKRLTSYEIYKLLTLLKPTTLKEILDVIMDENYKLYKNLLWYEKIDTFKKADPEDTKCAIKLNTGRIITHPMEFINIMYGHNKEIQSQIISIEWPKCLQEIEKIVLINCISLERFIFPNKFNVIDSYCFEHCKKINYVGMPNEVTFIGKLIFPYLDHKLFFIMPQKIGKKMGKSYFMRKSE